MAYCGECGTALANYPGYCPECGGPNGMTGGPVVPDVTGALPSYATPPLAQPASGTLLHYASWGARAGGFILDGLFTYVPLYIVLFIVFFGSAVEVRSNPAAGGANQPLSSLVSIFILLALLIVVPILYSVGFTGGSRGQTPGMRIAGVRVIVDDGSAPIGYGRALGRYVIAFLLGLIPFVGSFLDYLWPLWDERNQTLHDKALSTIVVQAR